MPKKILLADDSITIQKVVELTFSDGDYEVTACNNGLKAIQKLAEIRPDIVLSDIIMPEKNGYEVCEYVKSHPEFRHIPVILLTGTFEPFDPDRAEKAGCDAVVTKPFESQNLIHKVEDLIESSRQAASAASVHEAATVQQEAIQIPTEVPAFEEPPAESPVSSFGGETGGAFSGPAGPSWETTSSSGSSFAAMPSPFGDDPGALSAEDSGSPFGSPAPSAYSSELPSLPNEPFESDLAAGGLEHDSSIFATPEAQQPSIPMPAFEQAEPPAGETRAFPMMSFDEMRRMGETEAPPQTTPAFAMPESEPVHDSPFGLAEEDTGATRAFPSMSFDQLRQMAEATSPEVEPHHEATSASAFETSRFEATDEAAAEPPSAAPADDSAVLAPPPFEEHPAEEMTPSAPEPTPVDEPESLAAPSAFPSSSFEELSNDDAGASASPAPAAKVEEPEYEGATRAFPMMNFNDLRDQVSPAAEPVGEDTNPHLWSPTAPESLTSPTSSTSDSVWSADSDAVPAHFPTGEIPFPEPEAEPGLESAASEESSPFGEEIEAVPAAHDQAHQEELTPVATFPPIAAAPLAALPAPMTTDSSSEPMSDHSLSDEQIDRIARRVVEMMSEHMVRNIAWEIVPDLAEMIVKERIRQLENE